MTKSSFISIHLSRAAADDLATEFLHSCFGSESMKNLAKTFASATIVGIILGFYDPAFCQFAAVSTFPGDGATAISTTAALEFHFNAPLDTSARFARPADFFIGFYMYPEPSLSDVDSVTISYDMRTVRLHNLHLQRDTRYVCAIFGSRSVSGEPLHAPYVFSFTTASQLPKGRVSGNLGAFAADASNAMILFYTTPFTSKPEAIGVVSSDGVFEINGVPAGIYWPIAIKDMDRDGSFDPLADVDMLGAYDPNGDGFPDSLVVTDGCRLGNIDLTLFPYKGISDQRRYREANALGRKWAGDSRLIKVVPPAPVANGVSALWVYLYHSEKRNGYYAVFASNSYLWTFEMDCNDWDCRVRRPDFSHTAQSYAN
jgi:hypothetical protein